jgi:hypothetical protein
MNLRGLSGLTTSRISSENITLEYIGFDEYDDGTGIPTYSSIEKKGSVGILQPRDIERLEKAGIEVRAGVTIVVKEALSIPPDRIKHDGKYYRIVAWSFDHEFDEYDEYDEYAIRYGTLIAHCDEMPIAGVL